PVRVAPPLAALLERAGGGLAGFGEAGDEAVEVAHLAAGELDRPAHVLAEDLLGLDVAALRPELEVELRLAPELIVPRHLRQHQDLVALRVLERRLPFQQPRHRRPPPPPTLAEIVSKVAVRDVERHALHGFARHHALQELLADARQHRIGEDRVDHAAAAFHLGAALAHQPDDFVAVAEADGVVVLDALLDAADLQAND